MSSYSFVQMLSVGLKIEKKSTVSRHAGELCPNLRVDYRGRAGARESTSYRQGDGMSKVIDLHKEWSRDPGHRQAYEQLGSEFVLSRSLNRGPHAPKLMQAELAERMETTQSVVARIESGRTYLSAKTLEKDRARRWLCHRQALQAPSSRTPSGPARSCTCVRIEKPNVRLLPTLR